jgi:hypothetical protein
MERTAMTTPRQRKAEQAVIAHIRECGGIISYWWVEENKMRHGAWRRLVLSERVSLDLLPFPNWRVTIRAKARNPPKSSRGIGQESRGLKTRGDGRVTGGDAIKGNVERNRRK